jgi:cytoskeletal protein RodZ
VEEVEEELPELQLPRAEHVRAGKKEFLHRPAPDIPWKIVAVGVVAVILASVLWIRHAHHGAEAASSTLAPQPQVPVQTTAAVGSSPVSSAAAPNSTAPQPAAAVVPDATADDEKTDVVVRNFGKPLPKLSGTSSEKSSGALTLTVRASENSWISVTADGQPVTEETLIAPAHTTFHASQNFVVKVGNAAAVTFLWNGQEVPAPGGEGEVKTLVFDSNGMRLASSSQPSPAQPAANQ